MSFFFLSVYHHIFPKCCCCCYCWNMCSFCFYWSVQTRLGDSNNLIVDTNIYRKVSAWLTYLLTYIIIFNYISKSKITLFFAAFKTKITNIPGQKKRGKKLYLTTIIWRLMLTTHRCSHTLFVIYRRQKKWKQTSL